VPLEERKCRGGEIEGEMETVSGSEGWQRGRGGRGTVGEGIVAEMKRRLLG
jgi:hypothetical protein